MVERRRMGASSWYSSRRVVGWQLSSLAITAVRIGATLKHFAGQVLQGMRR